MWLYTSINKMLTQAQKNGYIVVEEEHIHTDNIHEGKIVYINYEKEEWIVEERKSGGKNECVWNTYEESFDTFIEALQSIININNPIELAKAFLTMCNNLWEDDEIDLEDVLLLEEEIDIAIDKIYRGKQYGF